MTMPNRAMTEAILLDVDGTLVLSNDAHAKSWVQAFDHFGYTITYDAVRPLIGMGGDKLLPALIPDLNRETNPGKEISEYRTKLFQKEYAPRLNPAPGSRELVQHLLGQQLRLMVASSAKHTELETLLKAAKVDDLLSDHTSSSDAENSKPDPDIIHAALDKLDLPADKVVMIGDTPYDIEAAGRAGVGLIAVRCGGWQDTDLTGSLAVYDDPADLLANYAASPLGLQSR